MKTNINPTAQRLARKANAAVRAFNRTSYARDRFNKQLDDRGASVRSIRRRLRLNGEFQSATKTVAKTIGRYLAWCSRSDRAWLKRNGKR
jgi:hypothetical protein